MRSRQAQRNEVLSFEMYGESNRHSKWHRCMSRGTVSYLVTLLVGIWIGSLSCSFSHTCESSTLHKEGSNCVVTFGTYQGPEYRSPDTVGTPQCLVENKFMKVQQHQVRQESVGSIIPDWLWIDYHDTVNVLVEAPGQTGHFQIFEQTKYGLEGRQSSAVVGGICEVGETPETTARREVQEEMGVLCKSFRFLGRFRTDVNRGAGWNSSFLATDCTNVAAKATASDDGEQIGHLDTERQDLRIVSLDDLRQRLREGNFIEVKWSLTVALALLHPAIYSGTRMMQ